MKRVLFVGQHPYGFSGNSHMLRALVNTLDKDRFSFSVFTHTNDSINIDPFSPDTSIPIVEGRGSDESQRKYQLIKILEGQPIDFLFFVGIDIWEYVNLFNEILEIKKSKDFVWICLIPYDLFYVRKDWLNWINAIDVPLVYSKQGYELVHSMLDKIHYFRPPLYDSHLFIPYSKDKRIHIRQQLAPHINPEAFIFGFFGNNQFRKDPQRLIKAFFLLKRKFPDIYLYLHTNLNGVYNLPQYIDDCGGKMGDVVVRHQQVVYDTQRMVEAYNLIDCLVNVSTHEGLSWTLLEAMLCGVPIIAANTTAQTELLDKGVGYLVPSTNLAYVPTITERGPSFVETRACDFNRLVQGMEFMLINKEAREEYIKAGTDKAKEWLDGVSNINEVLNSVSKSSIKLVKSKKPRVLFVQHSSAGDVLMSTQCFKGIKEKHNKSIDYMTQSIYHDIVVNNPYIDNILSWNKDTVNDYEVVYNPHGDKILPGGWNNMDTKLYDMYPYFCRVKPDKMFIDPKPPSEEILGLLPNKFIVVHTTGGSIEYRTYSHMGMVIKKLPYPVVQIGGRKDRT